MRDMIFALLLETGEAEKDALRLARSIRTFGGHYCFNPIWMLSLRAEDDLSPTTRQELYSLGVRLVSFELDPQEAKFPFLAYVTAAGIVEGLSQGETSQLVMMATNTLVLQEPSAFLLSAGKSFGGCPVYLKLLGSRHDEPVDDYWNLIYQHCHVDAQHIFPVQTIVDEEPVRAYFNAGLLVVRPERGLLRGWQANFERLYCLPEFVQFYHQSELYEIFMYQAVLAGSLLSRLKQEDFELLPTEVNYPLRLHSRMPKIRRPSSSSQLITCRYEDYAETFRDPAVLNFLENDTSLNNWLQAQLL